MPKTSTNFVYQCTMIFTIYVANEILCDDLSYKVNQFDHKRGVTSDSKLFKDLEI